MGVQMHRQPIRRAFTLVEMLTVIVIIGILASLITVAAYRAQLAARRATVKAEISQLQMALETYKTKYGEYPPDFVNVSSTDDTLRLPARSAVLRHLKKAFPRFQVTGADVDAQFNYFADVVKNSYKVGGNATIDPRTFDAASALFFWIGGLPQDPTASWKPAGFHASPTNPFQAGLPRTESFFDFTLERLGAPTDASGGQLRYFPRPQATAPYVYFRSRYSGTSRTYAGLAWTNGSSGIAVPYWEIDPTTNTAAWREKDSFQIICAGLDENFGDGSASVARVTRTGENFSPDGGDFDNLASFAEGTLESEINQ